jgi:transposase-like protein
MFWRCVTYFLSVASKPARSPLGPGSWRRQKGYARVAEHLEERVEECLTCLAFPEPHRRRIRTTNSLDRLNQGDKEAHKGGEDLPEQGSVPAVGYGLGGRAI